MTVLFCDVTGSTSLGEHLDSESLRRVMQRYEDDTLRAARAAVELRERSGPVNEELRA